MASGGVGGSRRRPSPGRAAGHATGPLSHRGGGGLPTPLRGRDEGRRGQGAAPRPIWAVLEDTGSWGTRPGASGPGGRVASPNQIPVTAHVAPGKPRETGHGRQLSRAHTWTPRGRHCPGTERRACNSPARTRSVPPDGLGVRGGHGPALRAPEDSPWREGPPGAALTGPRSGRRPTPR